MDTGAWDELSSRISACTACDLAATRTTVVVGQAPLGARILLLGEGPGALEDETGQPFVGRSGQLLDRLLDEVGQPRSTVAVLNVVKCRPPGNRPPTKVESATCRPWLDAQLELLDPVVIVPLGLTATKQLLGPRWSLGGAREASPHDLGGRPVRPSYHPSACLRTGSRGEPTDSLRVDLRVASELAAAQLRIPLESGPAAAESSDIRRPPVVVPPAQP